MTPQELANQLPYKDAIQSLVDKSIDLDNVVKHVKAMENPKDEDYNKVKSAWALYAYAYGNILYWADSLKEDLSKGITAGVAIETAKNLRDIAFTNFQEKLKYFEIFLDVKF